MIIFHEGLPGSGKSYEAVVKHLLPAIQSGREVYAYVEGLDFQRIAEVLSIPHYRVVALLHSVSRHDVLKISSVVSDNSLVIIDELQNFWPAGKQKLDSDVIQFVTEHRHRGIDILAMGQDVRDCHALWKRRIDQKVSFMKLNMLGVDSSYKWVVYKAVSGEKYQQVTMGVSKYDQKYFGTYKSHTSELIKVEDYKDSRAVVWNNSLIRLAVLFIIIVLVICIPYLSSIFSSDSPMIKSNSNPFPLSAPAPAPAPAPVSSTVILPVSVPSSYPVSSPPAVIAPVSPPDDYIFSLSQKYRIRLAASIISPTRLSTCVVEFRDSSFRVQERIDSETLSYLGWTVRIVSLSLVILEKQGQSALVATSWPITESLGQVSETKNNEVRDLSPKETKGVTPFPRDGGLMKAHF